jgi:hypothetical protein
MLASREMTLGDVARHFGIQLWQIQRLYQRGLLSQPRRIGSYRVVSARDLPVIRAALRAAGYLGKGKTGSKTGRGSGCRARAS